MGDIHVYLIIGLKKLLYTQDYGGIFINFPLVEAIADGYEMGIAPYNLLNLFLARYQKRTVGRSVMACLIYLKPHVFV